MGSEVIRGSSGTRENTNPAGHASGPSPQSRAVSNGRYCSRSAIFFGWLNVNPPSVDRVNEIPKFFLELESSKSRQIT